MNDAIIEEMQRKLNWALARITALEAKSNESVAVINAQAAKADERRDILLHPDKYTIEWQPVWMAKQHNLFVHLIKNEEKDEWRWVAVECTADNKLLLEKAQMAWATRHPDLAAKYAAGPRATVHRDTAH